MSITSQFPFAVSVPRYRRGRVYDPMSDKETLGSWSEARAAAIEGCLFAPGTSETFPNVEIEAISQYATLYLPLDADITEHDRVYVDGATWDVIGRRSNWRGGDVSGSTVPLRFVTEGNRHQEVGDE